MLVLGSSRALPPEPVAPALPYEVAGPAGTRIDPYYWLRDRDDPATLLYLQAENDYAESLTAHTSALRESLYAEMAARIPDADTSAAYPCNGYLYWTRYDPGMDYPVYMRRSSLPGSTDEVVLDVNAAALGFEYMEAFPVLSPDGRFAAVAMDTTGSLEYLVTILDMSSGSMLHDTLSGTDGTMAWGNDGMTLFYGALDSTWRTDRIMRHLVGTSQESDVTVFTETDPTFWPWVYKSPSDEYVFIGTESSTSSEVWLIDADTPRAQFRLIQRRTSGVEYSVTGLGDSLFILTNFGAANFRVMRCPSGSPTINQWREVVPARSDILVESVDVFPGSLVLSVRNGGYAEIRAFDRSTRTERTIIGGLEPCTVYTGPNRDPETGVLRFEYSSFTTPATVYECDLATGTLGVVDIERVAGGFDPTLYTSERMLAAAEDGAQVPVSIVYRGDLRMPGGNPLLLTGYGAYGYSSDPWFSRELLSLLDRGFVFAVAHVRGGSEMGRQWYDQGRLLQKRNTFTDFIACAEALVAGGFTTPDRLFASGYSAGGLLMGAVANMRPDLFRGIIAGAPFVDVVTTMLDPSIPLTTNEYEEWGNPAVKVFYDYMLSYSPYDNVATADYPAMLVTGGWNDSQVCYWEPAKLVAKIRATRTDDDPLILRIDMGTGHAGASGRFGWLREQAFEYAFLLDLAGLL